jgi:cysteine desulfurase
MAAALHLSYKHFSEHQNNILALKTSFASLLREAIPSITMNSGRFSLYSVLNVSFPKNEKTEFILTELDHQGICASGGSACSGGSSHVMKELGKHKDHVNVRFSFSKYNTMEEVLKVIDVIKEIIGMDAPITHNL